MGGYKFEYTGELVRVPINMSESFEIQAKGEEVFRWRFENACTFAQEVIRNQVDGDLIYVEVIRKKWRQGLLHCHATPINLRGGGDATLQHAFGTGDPS